MSDTDDNDDESTIYSKPHLDSRAVIALAASIPNCTQVNPPDNRSSSAGAGEADHNGDSHHVNPSSESNSSSYFSTFSRRLQLTFSQEDNNAPNSPEKEKERQAKKNAANEVLSFLVSDAYSIEQLAAEAEGKHTSTSELEGAGIARIDVYCQSGTAITCRVIKTTKLYAEGEDGSGSSGKPKPTTPAASANTNTVPDNTNTNNTAADKDIGLMPSMSRGSSFMHMLPTPRKGNTSETDMLTTTKSNNSNNNDMENNMMEGTQVRRIIKRKCTLEALRRILEQPPELPEINMSIINMVPDHYNNNSNSNSINKESDDDEASTVAKELRKRQQRRRGSNNNNNSNNNKYSNRKKESKFSQLSREQQKFLKQQQLKYEKRILRDEKMRQHVGNAILMGGMGGGVGSETGMDLSTLTSMSLDEATVASIESRDTVSISMMSAAHHASNKEDGSSSVAGTITSSHSPTSEAYRAQKAVQDKIEIADMGLAILMGEAQRLERIMSAMREENGKEEGNKGGGGDASTIGSRSTKESNRRNRGNNKKYGRKQSGGGGGDGNETDRSFSTFRSTDRSGTDRDSDDDSSLDSRDTKDDEEEEERKLARLMQGCEVEYSFPHEFHYELEGALMGDEVEEDSSSSSSESDSEAEASRASSRAARRKKGRGRSPPKGGSRKNRKEVTSPIVAIPTNGEGCVVLRENGAFDVIGKIPDVLQQKLFRSDGPLPDHVALGTLGRYYVHFADGSFYFYGPPSLSKILIRGNKKHRRSRGKRGDASFASIAFGKELDDFFVVRSDGSWEANGNMPSSLDDLMQTRKGRADLHWVSLGVNQEWCVRSKNGRVWWEGVSDEADEALADILAEDGENELKFIDFGKDQTYFLLHK